MVKKKKKISPLAIQETWVQSLGQKDLLEIRMATHSSVLTWRIPSTGEPGRLQSVGGKELDTTEKITHKISIAC